MRTVEDIIVLGIFVLCVVYILFFWRPLKNYQKGGKHESV